MTPDATRSVTGIQPYRSAEKTRRSGQQPDRRGEKCRAEAGDYLPIIDRNVCEGKRDCVEVCPYDVFEVRRISDRDFAGLSVVGKLKSMVHGRLTAYAPRAADCRACGLCVTACPEKAITLISMKDWLGRDIA
jgi:4Fe-4S ferredoxin